MAEAALLCVAKSVLQQLASPASKKFLLLWNLDKDFSNLQHTIQTVTDFLLDAEQRESKEHLVKGWLSRLRAVLYDADDLFDTVAARALRKKLMSGNLIRKEVRLFFSKSNQLTFAIRTAHGIKDIKERLDNISKDMSQFDFMSRRIDQHNPTRFPSSKETHSFVKADDVVGRDREKEELIQLLLPTEETFELSLSVLSIIGFGGLGKTTLAQLVFNDERVHLGFDLCLWACVNYFSDLKEALVAILTSILGSKPIDTSLDQLQRELRKNIEGQKYLLVLDDVWDEDSFNWRELKTLLNFGKAGSKIIATTRNARVAQCLNAVKPYYQLSYLSKESAWDLFVKSTFEEGELSNDSELVQLGEKIVQKCGYLPLALVTVGSMLRCKEKEKKTWLSFVDRELTEVLSDNNEDKIMKVLMISYNGLPPALKHCFAFCSLFPKDYKFDKDQLICMWLAQGFIEPHATKSFEEVGDDYFFYMVDRCFFQEVNWYTKDGYATYTCKMHDLLHDLAIQVAGTESACFFHENLKDVVEKSTLRHISINHYNPNFLFSNFVSSSHSKTLRTLLLRSTNQFELSSLNSIFVRFRMLRALQLSSLDVGKLPDSIGELIHLRYLDLSKNQNFQFLPDSICRLHRLQTLNLEDCRSLRSLPRDLGKLVSLRHLFLNNCDRLVTLPARLEELTALVTLDQLIVDQQFGGLRFLGHLDNLCGAVKINLRGNDWSNCIEDAKKSNMSRKEKLSGMIIIWYADLTSITDNVKTQAVLEALQPHENLQCLKIKGYLGDQLSSWVFSISNLKELILNDCPNLEYLQDNIKLGSFAPCLEILQLDSLPNLKGWWREVAAPGNNAPMSVLPSFSRVSNVLIRNCQNLKENMPSFKGIEYLGLYSVNEECIRKLINDLDKLNVTTVKILTIQSCKDLRWASSCGFANLTALEELEISDCGNVTLEDNGLGMPWKALRRLRCLEMPWQNHLKGGLQYLISLERLKICYFENSQVEVDNEDIESQGMLWKGLRRLHTLIITFNSKERYCFPKWIQYLCFLKSLAFQTCKELCISWTVLSNMTLQEVFFSDVENVVRIDKMVAEQRSQFNSLFEFRIHNTQEESWIHDIPWQLFPSIRALTLKWIRNFKSIPDGIQHLISLQALTIDRCKGLSVIPSWISNLISLQMLRINPCSPVLGKSCQTKTGMEWQLISHIPTIYMEWFDEDDAEWRKLDVKLHTQGR